jgi:NADH-quinone oxidoreductase subunit I
MSHHETDHQTDRDSLDSAGHAVETPGPIHDHNSDSSATHESPIIPVEEESPVELNKIGRRIRLYFGHIYEALSTVVIGLRITGRTFFQKPVTVQYPDVDMLAPWDENDPAALSHQVSERYRGFLHNDIETCTACGVCATACPVGAIKFRGKKYPEVKGMILETYDIDYALCIYCGLCVEVCPTESLKFQRKFENPVTDLSLLYKVFVTPADHERLLAKAPRKPAKAEKTESPTTGSGEKATPSEQPTRKPATGIKKKGAEPASTESGTGTPQASAGSGESVPSTGESKRENPSPQVPTPTPSPLPPNQTPSSGDGHS